MDLKERRLEDQNWILLVQDQIFGFYTRDGIY
jgi:hypothetical protein